MLQKQIELEALKKKMKERKAVHRRQSQKQADHQHRMRERFEAMFKGEPVPPTPSPPSPERIASTGQTLYDEDPWDERKNSAVAQLEKDIGMTIDQFADKHGLDWRMGYVRARLLVDGKLTNEQISNPCVSSGTAGVAAAAPKQSAWGQRATPPVGEMFNDTEFPPLDPRTKAKARLAVGEERTLGPQARGEILK